MGVFTDIRRMDGQDGTVSTDFFPTPLHATAAQALTESDRTDPEVRHAGMTASPVLAPGRRPPTVGKRDRFIDIILHVSSGHVNKRLLRETAGQHGFALTGVLQPCGGCLEAKDVRAGVPRKTISDAGRPMETVHINLAGPYEAFMGGSHYLIMFADSASRWMQPYGMRNESEPPRTSRSSPPTPTPWDDHSAFARSTVGVHRRQLRRALRRCWGQTQVHGLGQVATERGCRERDLAGHEGWPCGSPRDSTALPEHRLRPDPPYPGRWKPPVTRSRSLGRRLFQPLRDQGQYRVAVTVRGVLLATAGSAGGAILLGRHDAGGSLH